MRGLLVGGLVLIALQVTLSTPLAGLLGAAVAPARWAQAWMSPDVPLIPARKPAAPAAPHIIQQL